MSIFGSIVSAIFGSKHAAAPSQSAGASAPTQTTAPPAAPRPMGPSATAAPAAPAGTPVAQPMSRADVEAMIKGIADQQNEKLDWRNSIVDLMKLLKLDSSLGARKELAKELGYTGALDGSAEMNVWLHRQVMVKLAESGGKVPESLRV